MDTRIIEMKLFHVCMQVCTLGQSRAMSRLFLCPHNSPYRLSTLTYRESSYVPSIRLHRPATDAGPS